MREFSSDHARFFGRIARRFVPTGEELVSMEPASGGFSGADVISVITTNGRYALRRWSPGSVRERIQELHRYLSLLNVEGLPVAVPLAEGHSGERLIPAEGTLWQMEPWLPGNPASPSSVTQNQLTVMMETIARLHVVSARYSATPDGAPWYGCRVAPSPAVSERAKFLAGWTARTISHGRRELASAPADFRTAGEELLDRLPIHLPLLEQELQSVSRLAVRLHPCWRDLWYGHILMNADGRVSGLIDPAAARTEHVASDLSRLLGGLLEDDHLKWKTALQTYSKTRPLSDAEQLLIHVLDRTSVALSGLHWIERHSRGGIPDNLYSSATQRLQSFLRRVRALDAPLSHPRIW